MVQCVLTIKAIAIGPQQRLQEIVLGL